MKNIIGILGTSPDTTTFIKEASELFKHREGVEKVVQ
jgi:hypothetical protein